MAHKFGNVFYTPSLKEGDKVWWLVRGSNNTVLEIREMTYLGPNCQLKHYLRFVDKAGNTKEIHANHYNIDWYHRRIEAVEDALEAIEKSREYHLQCADDSVTALESILATL